MKSEHFTNKKESSSTFDDFIYGAQNKILVESLENAVLSKVKLLDDENVEEIDLDFIFLKGISLSGKSHLLEATAHKMKELAQDSKVLVARAKELITFFSEQKKYSKKIQELENLDLLLIDDIHLLAGEKECQEEISHLLEILKMKNALVVTSYSASYDLANQASIDKALYLEQNFYSRICSGLNFNISPPDIDIAMRYAQKECEKYKLSFTKSMCLTLARFCYDIRQLQGLLKTIELYTRANKFIFTDNSLLTFLQDYEGKKELSPDLILNFTAQYYSLQVKDLKGKSRLANIVRARQMSMFLCRKLLAYSYPRIAQIYGGKDHTTIMYACEKIEKDSLELELAQKLMKKIIQESSFVKF